MKLNLRLVLLLPMLLAAMLMLWHAASTPWFLDDSYCFDVPVRQFFLSGDGSLLLDCRQHGEKGGSLVELWDIERRMRIVEALLPFNIHSCIFSDDNHWVAFLTLDRNVFLTRSNDLEAVSKWPVTASACALEFSPCGDYISVLPEDGRWADKQVEVIRRNDSEQVIRLPFQVYLSSISNVFTPDGKICVVDPNAGLMVVNLDEKQSMTVSPSTKKISTLSVAPSQPLVAISAPSVKTQSAVGVWDYLSNEWGALPAFGPVEFAWSPDSRQLCIRNPHILAILDVEANHTAYVASKGVQRTGFLTGRCTVTRDGDLVVPTRSGGVDIYECAQGRLVQQFDSGPVEAIPLLGVAVAEREARIVALYKNGVTQIWRRRWRGSVLTGLWLLWESWLTLGLIALVVMELHRTRRQRFGRQRFGQP